MTETTLFDLRDEDVQVLDAVATIYSNQGFHYGWKSNNSKGYDQGHWNRTILNGSKTLPHDQAQMPLMKEEHPELMHLWNIIQAVIGERALLRVYINGYTYGTDGYSHTDDAWIGKKHGEDTLSETVIMYLNEDWHRDWAGETVIFNDNDDIEAAIMPKHGRVLIFDSNKQHAGRSVSRVCPQLRKVLVFKTIDPKALSPEVDFILKHTEGIDHSGKTFFEHLYGTALFLEKMNAGDDMVKAGLFHAIYGTTFFKHDLKFERSEIKDLIGERAEDLAWKFCQLEDRTNALITKNLPEGYDDQDWIDLIRLEIANLAEQNVNGRYIDQLTKLNDVLVKGVDGSKD